MLYVVIKNLNVNLNKSKFIKKQEAKGLLNNLVLRTLLSNISILRDVLF